MRVPRPHRPGRPHWRCTACGAPYPCGSGRLALLAEHGDDRISLAVLLAARMLDAAHDLRVLGQAAEIPGLHARFVGWLRRGAVTTAGEPAGPRPPGGDPGQVSRPGYGR